MNTLIIKKSHTTGTTFDAIYDDALTRAVKEQYPEIELKAVYCDFFQDAQGRQYTFNTSEMLGYCRRSFNALKEGRIKEIRLVIVEDELQQRHRKAVRNLIETKII
jgi:hypothetical protein